MKIKQTLPAAGLIAVTAVWGSTFFLIKDLTQHVPAFDFLAVRFLVAGVLALIVFAPQLRGSSKKTIMRGAVLGGVYAAAQIGQTIGLSHTSASVSGFVTGMYVVLTPFIAWLLLRDRISLGVWGATALATAGLMVLSLKGWAFGFGETLTLLGALGYAVHIVLLSVWAKKENPLALTAIQLVAVGVVCLPFAASDGITLPQGPGMWSSFLYMALVAGLGAILVQTWAQGKLSATKAAIILTCEPVFASLFAVLFGGESLTLRLVVGGSMVLAAMFLSELLPQKDPAENPASHLPAGHRSAEHQLTQQPNPSTSTSPDATAHRTASSPSTTTQTELL